MIKKKDIERIEKLKQENPVLKVVERSPVSSVIVFTKKKSK